MNAGAPRPELAQRLGGTQMPRLASRLLGLGRQELLRELRQRAEANPLLEFAEPEPAAAEHGWAAAAPGPSLGEHLAGQLETTPLPPRLRADALRCLVLLDDRGFLPGPATLAAACSLPAARARAARAAIRGLHPAGVGARDLADCLLLQLAALPATPLTKAAAKAVRDHFGLLARNRFDLLPKSCPPEVAGVIRQLKPNVANDYAAAAAYAAPDLVAAAERGYWRARLRAAPEVSLNEDYRAAARAAGDRRWLRLAREAGALVSGLRFRQQTLLAVAQALVDGQRGYFSEGPAALRPLRLRDLAPATGLALSTLSTVIKDKSIAGPWGTVPLRALLQRATGGGGAAGALQESIRALARAEDPAAPLSDAALAERLHAAGVKVSRRTAAKHRERAGLLPARLRRARQ